jgi:hypothetical protein
MLFQRRKLQYIRYIWTTVSNISPSPDKDVRFIFLYSYPEGIDRVLRQNVASHNVYVP